MKKEEGKKEKTQEREDDRNKKTGRGVGNLG